MNPQNNVASVNPMKTQGVQYACPCGKPITKGCYCSRKCAEEDGAEDLEQDPHIEDSREYYP